MLPSPDDISTWAQELGFAQVGITDVDLSDHAPHVRAWLRRGFAGDMGYLHRNLEKRLHPERLEPETCRVITARMNYLTEPSARVPLQILDDPDKAYVSRYALGRDYHKVLRKRLARLARRVDDALEHDAQRYRYRAFTDSAPVLEKALAQKSGLGWMGKNTLILNEQAGSWFFLGEIYTNAPLTCTTNVAEERCGKCNACITVCPTQAIVAPKTLDARRCISYLTIEHKGVIDEALRAPMGNRIYGCDDCQLYCPWNRYAQTTKENDFRPRHNLDDAELLHLFALDEAGFLALTEGSAMRRIGYPQWRRNLAIALGNGHPTRAAMRALQEARAGACDMVAEHIDWALQRLEAKAAETTSSNVRATTP
ncbi:MAG: tRNA epoxyqueuosine(34) reductase QueG [Pseudomonadota bacterium]